MCDGTPQYSRTLSGVANALVAAVPEQCCQPRQPRVDLVSAVSVVAGLEPAAALDAQACAG